MIFVGIEYTENVEIAERFNEYFINSIRDICKSIENNVPISNDRFNFCVISLMELENICRNMRKKKDYRRVSTGILLDTWNVVGNILVGDWNILRGLEGICGYAC